MLPHAQAAPAAPLPHLVARASASRRLRDAEDSHRHQLPSVSASVGRRARAAQAECGHRCPAARARKLASGVSPSAGAGNVRPISDLAPKPWWVQGDLDYMHARFCSPLTGRFLSVDPRLDFAQASRSPQLWNRYAYVANNPLRFVDPTGKSIWYLLWKVIKRTPDGAQIVVATIRNRSKQKAIERTKEALDTIDHRQRSQGVRRVVEAETDEARDAMARQLSTNREKLGPEQSSRRHREHVHPAEGPYRDVHVQTKNSGLVVAGTALLGQIFAPTTSAVAESPEPTPTELLSAASWDLTSNLDPTGASDLINWYFDIP